MQGRLGRLRRGWRWQEAAARLFHGQVPCNNGATMRVAPPGAYFVDELEAVMVEAEGCSASSLMPTLKPTRAQLLWLSPLPTASDCVASTALITPHQAYSAARSSE
jgi:hypothetical protein